MPGGIPRETPSREAVEPAAACFGRHDGKSSAQIIGEPQFAVQSPNLQPGAGRSQREKILR